MEKRLIYLDNNATTPIDPIVLDSMMPFLTNHFANANSTHQFGLVAYEAVKIARDRVAGLIGAETNEVVFTSGATEAINIAIKGVAEAYSEKGKHIITLTTEHTAVLDTCKYLEKKGYEVTYLDVNSDGVLDLELLKSKIRIDTILVCVMAVNNETGVLQPVREIAEITHQTDSLFMTDATQAVGKIDIDVDTIGADLMCFSGHKIYAPKGVGALFVRQRGKRVKIPALIHGGGHERGLRSGTLNVHGIVALGKACEIAKAEMAVNHENILNLRNYFEDEVLKIPDTYLNGSKGHRLYNVTNICFKNADSEAIIMGLSDPENDSPIIAISNGSACTSTRIEPSHVLIGMGLSENDAYCSIRFSLGKYNTKDELDEVINILNIEVANLRAMIF